MIRLKDVPQKVQEKLQQVIDASMKSVECTPNGIKLQGLSIFTWEAEVFSLTRLLKDYFPPMSDRQKYRMIREGLFHLACLDAGDRTWETLIQRLNEELSVIGTTTFQIICFLNARQPIGDHVTVDGTTFYSIDADDLRLLLPEENVQIVNPDVYRNLRNLTAYFYDVTVPGYQAIYGPNEVIDELIAPFERFRSLLNFNHHRGAFSFRFGGSPSQRAQYLPSPYTLVRMMGDERENFQFFYTPVAYEYRQRRISEKDWEQFVDLEQRLFQNVVRGEDSTADFVGYLLGIYQMALDATDQAIAFLHFWQVLERIASPRQRGRGIETKKVVSHLDTIVPLSKRERMVLMQLGEIRHEYVHGGNFLYGRGEEFNNIVKPYVDECLSRIIGSLDLIPTLTDLEAYFMIATDTTRARLKAIENAIQIVRERREKQKNASPFLLP